MQCIGTYLILVSSNKLYNYSKSRIYISLNFSDTDLPKVSRRDFIIDVPKKVDHFPLVLRRERQRAGEHAARIHSEYNHLVPRLIEELV